MSKLVFYAQSTLSAVISERERERDRDRDRDRDREREETEFYFSTLNILD